MNIVRIRQETDGYEEPTYEEVAESIKKIKNRKAAGHDNINGELIKYGGVALTRKIHELIVTIWKEERMPEEWKMGIIITIPKNGDQKICKNYRGITLLNVTYKVMTGIIKNRLTEHTEKIIGNYQYGFRKEKSTIDAIHIVRQIMEKTYEHNMELHMLFVDFKQAFDKLNRKELIEDLTRIKIPGKLIQLIKMTMKEAQAVIDLGQKITGKIRVQNGVRQGDALSTELFITALDCAIKEVTNNGIINKNAVQIVGYADDIVIVARDKRSLIKAFSEMEKGAKRRGLDINMEKTKYMNASRVKKTRLTPMIIDNYRFEEVDTFKYLGTIISRDNERIDLKQKLQAGNRAYHKNKKKLKDKKLSRNTKVRIYKTTIRPVVMYAIETNTLTLKEEEQLKVFERKIMRNILGTKVINENERRPWMNHEIEQWMKGENIVKEAKSRRLRWYGHISRKLENDPIKVITNWIPPETRARGRPKARWKQQVENDLRAMGIRNWKERTENRNEWRKIVMETKTHKKL